MVKPVVKQEPILTDLINARGEPHFGLITSPVGRINYMDYDLRSAMDQPRSRLSRFLGFNQFQFVALSGADFIAGAAIVDLRLVGNGFAYLFDFKTRTLEEFSCLTPAALGTFLPTTPDDGVSYCRWRGARLEIEAHSAKRGRDVRVNVGRRLEIAGQMREPSRFQPLRLCSRAGYNGWVYTQKAAGLPVTGELHSPAGSVVLDEQCRASYDWSCGFMRRETAWNWASISACLPDGRSLGLNLAAGVNETGVTENALWLDHRLLKLDLAMFRYNRYQPDQPWQITTSDKRVRLEFQPLGSRVEKVNAWLLASNFRQFFGYYSGEIRTALGEVVRLEQVPGLAEDHYAKW